MAEEELFQTYADTGQALELRPRSEVHRLGLWHKAVQVFVYRSTGELLLQQRAADKDLHAGHWDASVGEHLQPGETYQQGALRGLAEELSLPQLELQTLGTEQRLALRGDDYRDFEMQMAFRVTYDGPITFNEEIQAIRWVSQQQFEALLADPAYPFTPWFLHHLQTLQLWKADS